MAERDGSSNKDSDEEGEPFAPAQMKPLLSFSKKAVGLACAYSAAAAVDRDPSHILAAVVDEDIRMEADKPDDEADRQPPFCYRCLSPSGIQWVS